MKTKLFMFFAVILSIKNQNVQAQRNPNYPQSPRGNDVDIYFEQPVEDPYRALEDDRSETTMNWVVAQNKTTRMYLDSIPNWPKLKNRVRELFTYERISMPFRQGQFFYTFRNDGYKNHSMLYKTRDPDYQGDLLLDPNSFSKDGTSSLANYGFSKDGKYMAYAVSEAGSDWNEIRIIETETGKELKEKIKWVKFSGISFQGNGFYYSAYSAPVKGKEFFDKNQFQKIYYHTLGTEQSSDKLIFEDKKNPTFTFSANTTKDERFLILSTSASTSGNSLKIKDLKKPSGKWVELSNGFENDYSVVGNEGDIIYVLTNRGASRYKMVAIDIQKPEEKDWKTLLPESKDLLESVEKSGKYFIVKTLVDVCSRISLHNLEGTLLNQISLPGLGTVDGISSDDELDYFWFSFSSFAQPGIIYKCSFNNPDPIVYKKTPCKFNPDDFITKQEFVSRPDGAKIPVFITHRKDLIRNGDTPCFLYGYGGFNISVTPSFKPERMIFIEAGGIYAVANIRGGGEYGEEWHKAGTLNNKQNVFDDFIASAEYLINEKYTNSRRLAIHGRSNGGLLVGAVMTQRPDLFKVAIPSVGVLDMLRYHKFTIGYAWATDYGTSEDVDMFGYLKSYSPYHNVRDESYPATLITTADHDDRVVPAHSFKFAAALQRQNRGTNPVLIRIDKNAGHGAGKPISKQIDEWSDIWNFTFFNLGMNK